MESIVLDDGIEYVIVDEEIINGTKYTLFANINDSEDICFRKTEIVNGEEYFVGLKDEKEFKLALTHFTKKIIE